jgi:hypothetical protein
MRTPKQKEITMSEFREQAIEYVEAQKRAADMSMAAWRIYKQVAVDQRELVLELSNMVIEVFTDIKSYGHVRKGLITEAETLLEKVKP